MKKAFWVVCLLVLSGAVAFAGGTTEGETGTEGGDVLELTLHTIMVTEDPVAKGARVFAEKVKELSGGQIVMEVFDSAQLFPQGDSLDALTRGQIDFEVIGLGAGFEDTMPYMNMFTSGYIFTTVEHAQRFWSSSIGQEIFDDMAEKADVRPLGMLYYGTRQVSLTDNVDHVVKTPADLKGVKIRMANTPSWMALGEALGANPTPVAFNEVYLAMQTGVVDGQDNGLTVSKAMGFFEVTEQLVLTDHLVWNLAYAVNEDKWQSLTAQQRKWIQEAADSAHAHATELIIEGENTLLDWCRDQGIKIVKPDKQAFIEHARQYYKNNKEVTKDWDWEIHDAVAKMAD